MYAQLYHEDNLELWFTKCNVTNIHSAKEKMIYRHYLVAISIQESVKKVGEKWLNKYSPYQNY